MRYLVATMVGLSALAAAAATFAASDRPNAGPDQRQIKALSEAQIDDLLAGRGMGMALSAELNGLPGPRHVLDLADALGLTAEQRGRAQSLFGEMQETAIVLGKRVVEREAALNRLFAAPGADEAAIRELVTQISSLGGELRFHHLHYHLLMRDLLTSHQIALYRQARGYGADPAPSGHGAHQHQ